MTLSDIALNRALMERQMLDSRRSVKADDAIKALVGMQAQAPNPPYIGLWTRLADFRATELSDLVTSRVVVRIALMRGTVHLVSAEDCLALRALVQPVLDRAIKSIPRFRRAIGGLSPETVAEAVRAILADGPLTPAELGARLVERWPDRDPEGLAYAARNFVPLVHVPPRGVWGGKGRTRYATAEDWLGKPRDGKATLDDFVARYLSAYGPATVNDIQAWSGLHGLREVLDRMSPRLLKFRSEHGAELFDVPGAPLPEKDTPVPVRFLPEYDSILLAHADRTRIIADGRFARIFTPNGIVQSTFLVNGFVYGRWRIRAARGNASLLLEPFEPIPVAARDDLQAEGMRLLSFAAGDAASGEVIFAAAD